MTTEKIYFLAIAAVPILFSIVFHEVAHGWMANRLGDSTAKDMGRLTLNPVPHIDPVGTILVPIIMMILPGNFLFGWAKPVPFNPYNFYQHINMRKGTMWVAAAGPLSNLLLAIISAFLLAATQRFFPNQMLLTFFYFALFFNVLLGFFNMLPIPPLDGSKVLMGILPREYDRIFINMERYGFFILIILIASGVLRLLLMPINYIVEMLLFIPQTIFAMF
jgi:Zn-dependent protease